MNIYKNNFVANLRREKLHFLWKFTPYKSARFQVCLNNIVLNFHSHQQNICLPSEQSYLLLH